MRTVTLTPNVDGLIRWLRNVYGTDRAIALRIIVEGWPMLTLADAVRVLDGRAELADVLPKGGR